MLFIYTVENLLGRWIVSGQDPPEDCIDPLGVLMEAQASECVLKKMSDCQWVEFLHS